MTASVARPAPEILERDLQDCRVWRFITPDESTDPQADESYVVPETEPPGAGQFGSFLVAARYELANGSLIRGLVQVDILDKQIEFVPVTVFASGKAVDPLGRDAEARLRRILKETGVQPVRWCLEVLLAGELEPRSKSIRKPGLAQAASLLAQLARLKLRRRG
jgi:hypothetical protein